MKLADRMAHYKVPGVSVAVINQGRIEWARGYGVWEADNDDHVTTTTLFQAASISKAVTAMAALHLVQEGKLDLDEDVNRKLVSWHVPESEFTKEKKVTLRRLLSHSAGLTVHGYKGYASGEPVPTLLQVLDGQKPANSEPTRVDVTPGTKWRYAGGGYSVLQQLLIDVTGRPFPDFMQETVLRKLNMTDSTYQQPLPEELRTRAAAGHEGNGTMMKGKWHTYPEMAAAGLWTTPSDLARFAIEIQKSREAKSNLVLSADMTKQMLTRQMDNWGLGLDLKGTGRLGHDGANNGFSCSMVAYTEAGQGAVIMTNADSGYSLRQELVLAIAHEYGWPDYRTKEIAAVKLGSKILDKYSGEYEIAPNNRITILRRGDMLVLKTTTQEYDLVPESKTTFYMMRANLEINFIKDRRRRVSRLVAEGAFEGRKIK